MFSRSELNSERSASVRRRIRLSSIGFEVSCRGGRFSGDRVSRRLRLSDCHSDSSVLDRFGSQLQRRKLFWLPNGAKIFRQRLPDGLAQFRRRQEIKVLRRRRLANWRKGALFSHIFDRILRVESDRLSQRNRPPSPGRETLPSQTRLETQGCECWKMALPLLQQLLQLRCGGSWMLLNVLRLTEVNPRSKARF